MGKVYQKIEKRMPPALAGGIRKNCVIEALNAPQVIGYLRQGIVDAGILPDSTARVKKIPYIEIPAQWNIPEKATFIRLTFTAPANERNVDLFERYLFDHLAVFTRHGYHLDN